MGKNILEAVLGEIQGKYTASIITDKKIRSIKVSSDDRAQIKREVELALVRKKIEFSDVYTSASSFPATEWYDPEDGRLNRIVFKPIGMSMSRQTELVESAACIYISALINGYSVVGLNILPLNDPKISSKLKRNIDIGTTSYADCAKYIIGADAWRNSVIRSAFSIFSGLKVSSNTIAHRGSLLVRNIYKEFNRLKNKNELLRRLRVGPDKWNPSDIWLSRGRSSVIPKFDDLHSYTQFISKMAETKEMPGISIKHSSPNLAGVSLKLGGVKLITGSNRGKIEFRYKNGKSLNIKKPKTLMSSKSTVILLRKKMGTVDWNLEMEFRNSKPNTDCSGEILGTKSRHGKISLRVINHILRNNSVLGHKHVSMISDKHREIAKLYKKLGFSGVTVKKIESYGIDDEIWLSAKIQSMMIVDKILNSKDRDSIIEKIFNYADSKGLGQELPVSKYYKTV